MSSLQHAAVENHRLIRRARRPILDRRAMTSSKEDVAALRGILEWCRSNRDPAAAAQRERLLAENLGKAIDMLSVPTDRDLRIGWTLAALYDSVRKSPTSGTYYIVNRDLYTWAMDQLQVLVSAKENGSKQ